MASWLSDLIMLFFPVNCLVCGKLLGSPEGVLCLDCEYKMPRTGYRNESDNPIAQIFWGRVKVCGGTSLFKFEKGSAYQVLLHELKYRGNKKTGLYLGRLLGGALKATSFANCDFIIPVPLHRKRLRERGYNQSELIGQGVSEVLGIPMIINLLIRSKHHETQTTMGRIERFENVSGCFSLSPDHPDLSGKSIIIVDDVLTTGATMESCCETLLNGYQCKIYVATASCA